MAHYIECPICEERFHVQVSDPNKQVKCVGCDRKFLLSQAAKLPAPKSKSKAKPKVKVRLATPLSSNSSSKKSESAEDLPLAKVVSEPAPDSVPASVQLAKPSPLTGKSLQKRRRNKRKFVTALATVIGLAAVIGVLSGLLIMQLNRKPNSANDTEPDQTEVAQKKGSPKTQNDAPTKTANNTDGDSKGAGEPQAVAKKPKPQKKIKFDDLPPQKFAYHDKQAVNECWELVSPHLLSLTVHDAYGTHEAVGTIIDSRGWILTSYSAIDGASKIDVSASVNKIDELPKDDLLKDIVRGVISVDPSKNLAILSVNRRFTGFADIEITEENRVIDAEHLIQSTPPSPTSPYGRSETKMQFSGTAEKLSDSVKAEVAQRKKIAKDSYWLGCPDQQSSLPGSPLTRISGILEAIHVFNKDDVAYYVPVHELKALMASSKNEPQPMSVLGGADLSESITDVAVDHPMRKTSVEMNQLAKKCEEFNWIPFKKEEYDSFQAFSQRLVQVMNYAEQNKDTDPDLVATMKGQVDQFKNSIIRGMTKLGARKGAALRALNKFASQDLGTADRVVPFYGNVIALEVSHGKDVLELELTDTFVALIPDQKRDFFRYDNKCLAFAQTTSTPQTINFKVKDKKVSTTLVKLIFRINDNK